MFILAEDLEKQTITKEKVVLTVDRTAAIAVIDKHEILEKYFLSAKEAYITNSFDIVQGTSYSVCSQQ